METTYTKKVIKVEKYQTSDGKEFTDYLDAVRHEGYLRDEMNQWIKKHEIKEARDYFPYASDMTADNDYYWFSLQSEEDFKMMERYFGIDPSSLSYGIYCIEKNGYSGEYYGYTFDSTLRLFSQFLNRLGFSATIKKQEKI